ncbi:universal stress protein [Thermodesulfobacterium sp. TA1]|uniref:universal stress protein n=1 Tax=Thermodesulfobacterium sp. TA1 TaxID=2234087 RepID=UPI0012327704|nr:universal stress protein [Thermodesulfobacterium sp. TA1]QER42584.1 universal stress protein [Thermodesulfobacterium sp. TA1]
MCKFKKILVALDGSDASKHAFEEALKFAKEYGAEIMAVSVIPPYKGLVSSLSIFGHIKENIKNTYVKALEEAKSWAEEVQVDLKTFLEEGKPCEKVIEIAVKNDCDLIVTGRRGTTSFEKILIGSTAAKIINDSPIDVLIIPRKTVMKIKKILAATDGSVPGNNAVKRAGKIAKAYGATLNIASVIQFPPEAIIGEEELFDILKQELEKQLNPIVTELKELGVDPQIFIEKGEPHAVMVNVIKNIDASLLVIGADEETGKKLIGSAAQKIIANSPVPILIIKKNG